MERSPSIPTVSSRRITDATADQSPRRPPPLESNKYNSSNDGTERKSTRSFRSLTPTAGNKIRRQISNDREHTTGTIGSHLSTSGSIRHAPSSPGTKELRHVRAAQTIGVNDRKKRLESKHDPVSENSKRNVGELSRRFSNAHGHTSTTRIPSTTRDQEARRTHTNKERSGTPVNRYSAAENSVPDVPTRTLGYGRREDSNASLTHRAGESSLLRMSHRGDAEYFNASIDKRRYPRSEKEDSNGSSIGANDRILREEETARLTADALNATEKAIEYERRFFKMSKRYEEQKNENDKLRADLQNLEAHCDSKERKLKESTKVRDELHEKSRAYKDENSSLRSEVNNLKLANKKFSIRGERTIDSNAVKEQRLKSINASLQAEKKELELKVSEAELRNEKLEEEKDTYKQRYAYLKDQDARHGDEIMQYKELVEQNKQKLREKELENDNLRGIEEKMKDKLLEFEENNTNAQKEIERLKKERDQPKQDTQLYEEVQRLRTKNDEFKQKLTEFTTKEAELLKMDVTKMHKEQIYRMYLHVKNEKTKYRNFSLELQDKYDEKRNSEIAARETLQKANGEIQELKDKIHQLEEQSVLSRLSPLESPSPSPSRKRSTNDSLNQSPRESSPSKIRRNSGKKSNTCMVSVSTSPFPMSVNPDKDFDGFISRGSNDVSDVSLRDSGNSFPSSQDRNDDSIVPRRLFPSSIDRGNTPSKVGKINTMMDDSTTDPSIPSISPKCSTENTPINTPSPTASAASLPSPSAGKGKGKAPPPPSPSGKNGKGPALPGGKGKGKGKGKGAIEEFKGIKLKPFFWNSSTKSAAANNIFELANKKNKSDEKWLLEDLEKHFLAVENKSKIKDSDISDEPKILTMVEPSKEQTAMIQFKKLPPLNDLLHILKSGKFDKDNPALKLEFATSLLKESETIYPLSKVEQAYTKAEEYRKKFGKDPILGKLDQMFVGLAEIPHAKELLRVWSFVDKHRTEASDLIIQIGSVLEACDTLMRCEEFHSIFGLLLVAGNRLNAGTLRSNKDNFAIESLPKFAHIKTNDSADTLLGICLQKNINTLDSNKFKELAVVSKSASLDWKEFQSQVEILIRENTVIRELVFYKEDDGKLLRVRQPYFKQTGPAIRDINKSNQELEQQFRTVVEKRNQFYDYFHITPDTGLDIVMKAFTDFLKNIVKEIEKVQTLKLNKRRSDHSGSEIFKSMEFPTPTISN